MKKYLLLLALPFFLLGCNDDDIPKKTKAESMTILSYLVANNNLDDDLLANIGAMYDGLGMDKPQSVLMQLHTWS